MSDDSLLFTRTAEALLAGEIICFHRTPELHTFLSDGATELAVGDFLRRIGRRLSKTSDDASWFAVYRNLESDAVRRAVGRQFGEVINNLEPLVIWLQMSGAFGRKGRPLQTGDSLKTSELLAAIETAAALREDLDRLSGTRMFHNTQSTPQGQLNSVLKKLVEEQFLVPVGKTNLQYVATGKWSRLYDLLEFIAAHEQLEIEDDDAETQPEFPEL